jgi:ADP-ribose pyrophosphatase YjhB (NUDIX family)
VRKSCEQLTVRGRTQSDLLRLRRAYLPELSGPHYLQGTDYPWRGQCTPSEWAQALVRIAGHIDYANFKDEVTACIGPERARRYLPVWDALYGMKEDLPEPLPDLWPGKARRGAYGGILVDPSGRILLLKSRDPAGAHPWTFPMARPESQEAPHEAALRAVLRATGVSPRLLLSLPGTFRGIATPCRMALMLIREPAQVDLTFHHRDTLQLAWVSMEQARHHIAQNPIERSRDRDLAILEAAQPYLAADLAQAPITALDQLARRPLPALRGQLTIDRPFTPSDMARLIRGLIPQRSGQPSEAYAWCAAFERGVLHIHRTETGTEFFRLQFEAPPEGSAHWHVARAEFNAYARQQRMQAPGAQALLESLLSQMLSDPTDRPT